MLSAVPLDYRTNHVVFQAIKGIALKRRGLTTRLQSELIV